MSWPDPTRVRAALSGRHGELLRMIADQPYRGTAAKHLITGKPIPAPEPRA